MPESVAPSHTLWHTLEIGKSLAVGIVNDAFPLVCPFHWIFLERTALWYLVQFTLVGQGYAILVCGDLIPYVLGY